MLHSQLSLVCFNVGSAVGVGAPLAQPGHRRVPDPASHSPCRGARCRFIEPLEPDPETQKPSAEFVFESQMVGQAIPSGFLPGIEKGFQEAANR